MRAISKAVHSLRQDLFTRFDAGIWTLTALELLNTGGFAICLPFLSLYLYQDRGLDMTLVGTIILIAGLCAAVTSVVGGGLTDRFGRRPLMIISAGLRIFLFSGMAVLIGISAPVWAIVVIYVVQQSVGMIGRPAISAMVADLSPKDRLTETFGLLRIGRNVGWAAGPALGGYLATFLPYSWLFGVTAIICAVTLIIILLFVRESLNVVKVERVAVRSMFSAATDRTLLAFAGLSLLVFLVSAQLVSALSVFTVDQLGFSTAQYGLLLTVNGLIVVFFQYPIARGISQRKRSLALIIGSLLYGIGYLSLGWVKTFDLAILSIVIITAGEIIFSPATLSIVGELSPRDQRGRYMGFFGLNETLSMAIGPFIGGILLDSFPANPVYVWGIVASLAFVAVGGFILWSRSSRLTPIQSGTLQANEKG